MSIYADKMSGHMLMVLLAFGMQLTCLFRGVYGTATNFTNSKLLVIVLDGLRWDAVNTTRAQPCPPEGACVVGQYFTAVQEEGATAAWMAPVFPTTAAPNIFTMATGELPVDHGVLGELESGGEWNLSSAATPLWGSAAQLGLKTALLRWLDCSALHEQDDLVSCVDRVQVAGMDNLLVQVIGDAAIAADSIINQGYSVVLMRSEALMWTALHYGLGSGEAKTMFREVELVLDDLFRELKAAAIWDELSVVLTSGSGLTSVRPVATKGSDLGACLATDTSAPRMRYASAGSVLLMPGGGGTADQVIQKLQNCSSIPNGALKIYKMSDLAKADQWPGEPEEILIIANPGFSLKWNTRDHRTAHEMEETLSGAGVGRGHLAGNGFSALDWDMKGIFMVKGPDIQHGVTGPSVSSHDVHSVLQHLMKMPVQESRWQEVSWIAVPSSTSSKNLSLTVMLLSFFYDLY